MQNIYEKFHQKYDVSKTLRFSLIPQEKTLDHIEKAGLLGEDEHRAESYKKVKKLIDQYIKYYIDLALSGLSLEGLDNYADLYYLSNRSEKENKELELLQNGLRKQISKALTSNEQYKVLFSQDLIKKELPQFVDNTEDKLLISEFDNFSTYFNGFYQNRANMFSDEAKSSTISYRLIHENLPKFLDNVKLAAELMKKNSGNVIVADDAVLKKTGIESASDVFHVQYFQYVLTQRGIDKYNYIIGGVSSDEKSKDKGVNEYINLYNQQNKIKIGKMKKLFKQILTDRESLSFLPEMFEDDQELIDSLEDVYDHLKETVLQPGLQGVLKLFGNTENLDKLHIYIKNDTSLTNVSQRLFNQWSYIKTALAYWFDETYSGKKKKGTDAYGLEKEKFLAKKSFSIALIEEAISMTYPGKKEQHNILYGIRIQIEENLAHIKDQYTLTEELLNTEYTSTIHLSKNTEDIEKIKGLLDSLKELQSTLKLLRGSGDETDKDPIFYGDYDAISVELDAVTAIYNKVRNYISKKSFSTEKIKLNFQNSTLLNGWDLNKEKDNLSVILRKGNDYYLGIINKQLKKKGLFENLPITDTANCYQKMEYKLLPGANKMLPKVFFSKSRIEEFAPSAHILNIYEKGTFKKGEAFSLKDCHELIDFFKASINKHPEWKNFDFSFSDTSQYEDISGFYREVENQGYKLRFIDVPTQYVDQLVNEDKLYLFQIYSKDFSSYSKGKPNLHTLFWKMLFDERNLYNPVYKLNGQAEIFYRKASIKPEERIIHNSNKPIAKRNDKTSTSIFLYDLIKDKRYTMNHFEFHVPLTLNFQSEGQSNINLEVNKCIKGAKGTHVIGIDRGERNLLYLVVIDETGKLVEQIPLNTVPGNSAVNVDYRALLDKKENERKNARINWNEIENIKELKDGYLSQVVYIIAKLMQKYQAVVVLEDLNSGFMRGRQKIEKQVYQKFEKRLIDKLNYLVFKEKEPEEVGGLLKAYQLTNKFDSFQKLGKQSGFLYYVPAWNTSKMDPTTGFVNLLETRYSSVENSINFFSHFDDFRYNKKKGYFEINLDYSKFTHKANGSRIQWTLCTFGSRIETYRNPDKNNEWDYRNINLTEEWKKYFSYSGIDFVGENIKEQILHQKSADFFRGLYRLLKLTLQMRNSKSQTEIDYLISPVMNKNAQFFDTREGLDELPKDADANGAYNIARKGLWIIEQLKQTPETELGKVKLAISNKEWLSYAQK